MSSDAGLCRTCWTWNIAGELVCKRCGTAMAFVPEEIAAELYQERERKTARKERFYKSLPVVLPVLLALIVFGGFRLVNAVARELGPVPGYDLPSGFRVNLVEPFKNRPLRFDPCTTQHYVINPTNAPPSAVKDVRGAVRRLEEATGMKFVYDGISHEPGHWERPLVDEQRYGERWAPILIAWVPYDQLFFPDDYTYAAALPAWATNSDGDLVTVGGTILVNASRTQRPGFGTGWTWGHVLMHEWGHIVGLGHIDDEQQVMHQWAKPDDGKWGDGDLIGLRAMGRRGGCQNQPQVEDYEEPLE
ncbi:MAG: matrixin family metalloprotease [Actinomycetota bacterium]